MRRLRLGTVGAFLLRTKILPIMLVLAVLGGAGFYFTRVQPALAAACPSGAGYTCSNLHYPWVDATNLQSGKYDFGYNLSSPGCPRNDVHCDDITYTTKTHAVYGEADPWKYYLRNCTSYVAWKLSTLGVDPKYFSDTKLPDGTILTGRLGDGGQWYSTELARIQAKAPNAVPVGTTPQIGAAAVSPSTDHVAFVSNITYKPDGKTVQTITVNEYNQDEAGDGDVWTGPPGAYNSKTNPLGRGFTEYVYFGKVETKVSTTTPTSIRVKGTVHCTYHAVAGVWVWNSYNGGNYATISWTSSNHYAANYTWAAPTTLPTTVQLHVGCGGTSSSWWSNNFTLQVKTLASVTLNATCNEGTTKPPSGSNTRCHAPTLIISL